MDEDGVIFALGDWKTNGEMIADVFQLYVAPDARVLDPTHGLGRWWTSVRPSGLVACDLNPKKSPIGYAVDFRDLPFPDNSFDVVAFDPGYKLNGTPSGKMDEDYGVDEPQTIQERHQLMMDGMSEAWRVLDGGGLLMVKCQNQVASGKVQWQEDVLTAHALSLGFSKKDLFLFKSYRKNRKEQVHARRNYSALLVFQVPKAKRAADVSDS